MDDGHAAVVGELPQIFGPAADADLDGPLGIEHACQHRLPERPAMVELGPQGPARVAMGVDVHQPDRPPSRPPPQDRQRDRVVAADLSGATPAAKSFAKEGLDVLRGSRPG